MKNKIIVIGSSNTDMIVKVKNIPRPGETVLGTEFLTVPGGKGANQAVAAARTGGNVSFIACVGNDTFGQQAIEQYKKHNIDTTNIKTIENVASGIALINVAQSGENSISVAPGANARLMPEHIEACEQEIKQAKVVLLQLEIPVQTVKTAIDIAHKHGVKIILNPAPAQLIDDETLKKVDFFTPNETEIELFYQKEIKSTSDLKYAAGRFIQKGTKNVLITLGKEGVFAFSPDINQIIPSYSVNTVDTTAAGDVFNGALAVAVCEGTPLRKAIRFANAAAALTVTKMGAQSSIPDRQEITEFLK